jgi:hypothetical protein
MNEAIFKQLISGVAAKLNVMEQLGTPVTTDLISRKIDDLAHEYGNVPNFEMTSDDVERLKFHIGNMFNVRVGEAAITLQPGPSALVGQQEI